MKRSPVPDRLSALAAIAVLVWTTTVSVDTGVGVQGRNASAAPPPIGTLIIRGRVLERATGRPVVDARVTLTLYGNASGGAGRGAPFAPTTAVSDASGRFIFERLAAGQYALTAVAPGYAPGAYLATRLNAQVELFSIASGETTPDLEIRLDKYGSISGLVLDIDSAPAANVPVTVFQRYFVRGHVQLSARRDKALTDDRGRFTIDDLPGGNYVVGVVVTEMSQLRQPAIGAPAGRSGRNGIDKWMVQAGRFLISPQEGSARSYATTYFPDATLASNAGVIRLGDGEDRTETNLRLRVTKSHSVSGAVVGSNSVAGMKLRLMARDSIAFASDIGVEVATTEADSDGHFAFLGVPPGEYIVRGMVAQQQNGATGLWVDVPISVDSDIYDLSVLTHPCAKLAGRLRFVGTRQPPTAAELGRITVVPGPVNSSLITSMSLSRVSDSGTFITPGLPKGDYFITLNPAISGWHVESIVSGRLNLIEEPIVIDGQDQTEIVVTLSDQATGVTGSVEMPSGGVDTAADVIVFPSDSDKWRRGILSPFRVQRVSTSRLGTFAFDDVPPGGYWLAAADHMPVGASQDPAYLQSLLPRATRIEVRKGERPSVRLQAVVLASGR